MIRWLAKRLIKNSEQVGDPTVRRGYGVLCGWMGIALNVLLFAGKLLAGLISGSIAITADAFNNLSDAGSSVVTLLGFKLASQKPDSEHPFGHGRMEYVSGLVVSMVILLMGVELIKGSVEKILHPEAVVFRALVAVILLVSIAVKFYMFLYNRTVAKMIDSAAMSATASDCLGDSIATAAVLLSTVVGHFWDLQIDGWCGVVVACFIFWAGISAARETITPLLGRPAAPEFVRQVEELVLSHPEIMAIHDLIVHDYGPGRQIISLHAEVPADGDILELHDVVDSVERELAATMGCLTTIHMDPVVSDGGITAALREKVTALVHLIEPKINIHDFRIVPGPTHTNVIFDAVVPYDCYLSDKEVAHRIREAVRTLDGNYYAVVEVEKSYV